MDIFNQIHQKSIDWPSTYKKLQRQYWLILNSRHVWNTSARRFEDTSSA